MWKRPDFFCYLRLSVSELHYFLRYIIFSHTVQVKSDSSIHYDLLVAFYVVRGKINSSSSGVASGLGEPQLVEKLHELSLEGLDFGNKKFRITTYWMFELRISHRGNAHCPIRSKKGEKEVLSQSVKITSKPVKEHHQLWDHWGNYFRRKPITPRIPTILRIPRMCIHRTL